jgi:FkbM family methyltransferase
MGLINILGKLLSNQKKESLLHKMGAPHMFWSIRNLAKLGFQPKVIFDIGAYKGEWTERVNEIFPYAAFFMFEGQKSKENDLKKIKNKISKSNYYIGLLGAENGKEVFFSEIETASNISSSHKNIPNQKLSSLNVLVRTEKILLPEFIKIDVQGYELEVLKGATEILNQTEVILLEISLLDIGDNNTPLLIDVLNFMYSLHFVAYDICSVTTRRPLDQALWQTDIIFVKEDSKYRASKAYN